MQSVIDVHVDATRSRAESTWRLWQSLRNSSNTPAIGMRLLRRTRSRIVTVSSCKVWPSMVMVRRAGFVLSDDSAGRRPLIVVKDVESSSTRDTGRGPFQACRPLTREDGGLDRHSRDGTHHHTRFAADFVFGVGSHSTASVNYRLRRTAR